MLKKGKERGMRMVKKNTRLSSLGSASVECHSYFRSRQREHEQTLATMRHICPPFMQLSLLANSRKRNLLARFLFRNFYYCSPFSSGFSHSVFSSVCAPAFLQSFLHIYY